MNNKFNKILAIVLCLVMAIGSVAAVVEGDPTPSPVPTGAPVTTEAPVETAVPSVPPVAETEASVEESPVPTAVPAPTPLDGPDAPVCTCEATDAEKTAEGFVHAKDCPLYVPVCTCEGTEEEKAAEGFVHAEGCDFYVAPGFDAVAAKEQLLACDSIEAVETFAASLTEEQIAALMEIVTEDELRSLAEKLGVNLDEEIVTPPADYSAVGPLMPAVTVQSVRRMLRAAPAPQAENGLILNKEAIYDEATGKTKITLEAYTTGTVTTSSKSTPVDVVLVLDESGSMADKINQYTKVYELYSSKDYYVKSGDSYIKVSWCNGGLFGSHDDGWYTGGHFVIHWGTRYDPMTSATDTNSSHVQFYEASATSMSKNAALVAAAKEFANKVYNDAVTNEVDHRISVIGFSGNNASEIKVGLTNDIRNNLTDVTNAIDGLKTNGGTYIEDGLANAETAFRNATPTSAAQRKRVVVIFTDGVPGSGTWNNETINGSANPAINSAYTLKNTFGATVYSIGMLNDANPELPINDKDDAAARTNKFLHYLSSNYPDATSMSNGGSGSNQGYYLSASDTASLTAIFEKISQEIATPSIPLDSTTVIKDIIAPSFTVPANTSDIKLYTEDYNGTEFDGGRDAATGVTPVISGDTISVNGFDFNANFVSATAKPNGGGFGKKLIIEFEIETKEGFLGGNNVETNGEQSGVYLADGTEVELFMQPKVDIPITYRFESADQTIYLGEKADLTRLSSSDIVPDGSNNAYVDIRYTVTDPEGKPVGTMTIPAGETSGEWTWTPDAAPALEKDTKYTINCVVSPSIPKVDGVANWEETKSATVYVRTCTLTITKQGSQDDNQGFIFKVTGPKAFTVSVQGNRSVTIAGLPIGSYTVTEDGWSWRYSADGEKTAELTPTAPAGSVTVNNALQNPYLLDGSAYAQNNAAKPAAKG